MPESPRPSRDFDFEFGMWQVRHRSLKERLVGCDEWEEFNGTSNTRPVLGGNGNVEDNFLEFPCGFYRAIAILAFKTETQTCDLVVVRE